jgi:hypothetical protein
VDFATPTGAPDPTTPTGRAKAELPAIHPAFEAKSFSERDRAWIDRARPRRIDEPRDSPRLTAVIGT